MHPLRLRTSGVPVDRGSTGTPPAAFTTATLPVRHDSNARGGLRRPRPISATPDAAATIAWPMSSLLGQVRRHSSVSPANMPSSSPPASFPAGSSGESRSVEGFSLRVHAASRSAGSFAARAVTRRRGRTGAALAPPATAGVPVTRGSHPAEARPNASETGLTGTGAATAGSCCGLPPIRRPCWPCSYGRGMAGWPKPP